MTSDMDFGQLFADTKLDKISLIQFRVSDFTATSIINKLQLIFENFRINWNRAILLQLKTTG